MILTGSNSTLAQGCLSVLLMLTAGQVGAGTVSVTRSPCAPEVTLRANDALLSEVFTTLAGELGFDLLFDRGSDRNVTIDATRDPEKLIESLTRNDNVMVTTAADPECDNGTRITEVRFLAAGDPIFFPAHRPDTAKPSKPVTSAVTNRKNKSRALRFDDSEKKKRREMTAEEKALDRQRQRQGKKR